MNYLFGTRIVVAAQLPKLTLSEDVPVTDEFRADFDAWAREFFGYYCPAPEGRALMFDGYMLVHPNDYQRLKEAFPSEP